MSFPTMPALCEPSRREARRQSRQDAILEVAGHSFLERGYAATTMSAIAAELGGSKGTLWSYFPSKEILFAAVLDRATETFQRELTVILNPQDDLDVTLGRFARSYLQRVTLPKALALHRLIVAEAARFPETGRIFNDRCTGRVRSTLAAYLAHMAARGLLNVDAPEQAAQELVALCLAGSHQLLLIRLLEHPDPDRIDADASGAVAMFMRAYGA